MRKRLLDTQDPNETPAVGRDVIKWPPASVLYHYVGKFLGDSFWDHWHFSQTNRALWYYYREHDPCIRAMERYVFDAYAREHELMNRRRNILSTGILRCLEWMWEKESHLLVKEILAEEYMSKGAAKGNLEVIRHFSPHISETGDRNRILATLIRTLTHNGRDDAACRLFSRIDQWLPGWTLTSSHYTALYITAATYAYKAPNFCTLMYKMCLENIDNTPNTKVPDQNPALTLFVTSLLSVLSSEQLFEEVAFRYFWDKAPQWHALAAYDLCSVACTSIARDGPNGGPSWYTIISRLPYVLSRFDTHNLVPELTGTTKVRWSFNGFEDLRKPSFSFGCEVMQACFKTRELQCRVSFQCVELRMMMNLLMTIPIACSAFCLGEDGNSLVFYKK